MRKEEFIKLANSRPRMPEASYYQLTTFVRDDKQGYVKDEYGAWHFPLYSGGEGIYSDREHAERTLRENPYWTKDFTSPVCAIIERIPFNAKLPQEPIEWWLYDGDGNEIDHSVCSAYHVWEKTTVAGKYLGRKENEIRFRKGDRAMVFNYDHKAKQILATFVIITETPATIEEEWEYFDSMQEENGEYPFDGIYPSLEYFHSDMDDEYAFFTGSVELTAPSSHILPLLPSPSHEAMDKVYETFERRECAKECHRKYDIGAHEYMMIMNGEITEEDIRVTRRMSEYVRNNPGKEIEK